MTSLYPPAPWYLQGQAVLSLQPINIAQARSTQPKSIITVHRGTQLLCQLTYEGSVPLWRQRLPFASFGNIDDKLLWFNGSASVQPHFTRQLKLQVPGTSPFASLGLHQPWLTFVGKALSLEINPPETVNP